MEKLFELAEQRSRNVPHGFIREPGRQINWESRLIEIRGSRGVGKTTLMLQRFKDIHLASPGSALYVSLHDLYFFSNSLVDLADQFVRYGGKILFIDEVHKYPARYQGADWSVEIKIIFGRYPELKIVYSGSSILRLFQGKGDLSRRKNSYMMHGLSFREYLLLKGILDYPALPLEEILKNHSTHASKITGDLKIFPYFRTYLREGYYPYLITEPGLLAGRIEEVINQVLETDIPAVSDLPAESVRKMKRLLAAVASSAPYIPNLTSLRQDLEITDQRTLMKYLNFLEAAELITMISKAGKGNSLLRKPDKLYVQNTNLAQVLSGEQPDSGNLRETFILSQLRVHHRTELSPRADFLIDKKITLEVGGPNKKAGSLRNQPDTYVLKDNIETGLGNSVPLWLFGFLY